MFSSLTWPANPAHTVDSDVLQAATFWIIPLTSFICINYFATALMWRWWYFIMFNLILGQVWIHTSYKLKFIQVWWSLIGYFGGFLSNMNIANYLLFLLLISPLLNSMLRYIHLCNYQLYICVKYCFLLVPVLLKLKVVIVKVDLVTR